MLTLNLDWLARQITSFKANHSGTPISLQNSALGHSIFGHEESVRKKASLKILLWSLTFATDKITDKRKMFMVCSKCSVHELLTHEVE